MNYVATDALNFNLSGAYTNSEGYTETIDLGGPTSLTEALLAAGTAHERWFNYNFSDVSDYSDLDIEEIDLTAGFAYEVTSQLSVGAEYNFLYYRDKDPYLADGTGGAHIGLINLTFGL